MSTTHIRTRLGGEVLEPGDEGYAEASGTRFARGAPALIVRPRTVDDVAAAIRYAAAQRLALSVRSGGHSPLGHGTNDGGMVIDLGHLDAVQLVDPVSRVVRIGGGATWGRVAAALAPHGLGLTAGDTASVGVGGLTLGGGVGWMVRKHGLAIDNLVAARVVTGDGRVLVASEEEHADLFWAVRGGGGNFGVVVSFDFVAQPVRTVQFGTLTYRLEDPAGLVRGWRDHMRRAPDALTTTLSLRPPMFGGPASATVSLCYAADADATDDTAAATRAIEPLLGLAAVTESTVAERPYAGILEEAHHPPGIRVVARNTLVPALDDDVIAAVDAAHRSASPIALSLRSLGGAFGRVAPDATAFAHRDAEAMVIGGAVVPEHAGEADVAKALAPWRDIAGHGTGLYVNFQGSATPADIATAYPPATYARLAAAKRRYDPGNLFDRNHNVAPSDPDRTEGPAA